MWLTAIFKKKEVKMALPDQITANQQAVVDAQTALDAANAQLKDAQDKMASLDALESAANTLVHAGIKQLVSEFIAQQKGA